MSESAMWCVMLFVVGLTCLLVWAISRVPEPDDEEDRP